MRSPPDYSITVLGETLYRDAGYRFGIKQADRLAHMWILGKTGTGKSTLLKNMIAADLEAGRGFMVIDPHGDLVEAVLDLVPEHRIADTVYFNPADTAYPVAFNPLDHTGALSPSLVTSAIVSALKKTWPDFWGPRMEYVLRSSLLTLLAAPGATLLDLHRLLVDAAFRKTIVSRVTDPQLVQFWAKEFSVYTKMFRTEATSPIVNKTGQYLSTPMLRNILGQRTSTVSVRSLMDGRGIFLANLAKGRLGEDVMTLLGSLLVSEVAFAALTRIDTEEPMRHNFFLYIDEAHLVTTRAMVDLFPEARKFHLGVVFAHQYLDQLDEPLRHAVLGNTGSLLAFRIGARDAFALAKEFMPEVSERDLVSLPAYHLYLKLMVDGATSRPFSATTLPPPTVATPIRDRLIAESRHRYARPAADVEAEILAGWKPS